MSRKKKTSTVALVPNFTELSQKIKDIIQKNRKVRVRVGFQFFNPGDGLYYSLRGQSITFDTGDADLVLSLPAKVREMLGGLGK